MPACLTPGCWIRERPFRAAVISGTADTGAPDEAVVAAALGFGVGAAGEGVLTAVLGFGAEAAGLPEIVAAGTDGVACDGEGAGASGVLAAQEGRANTEKSSARTRIFFIINRHF